MSADPIEGIDYKIGQFGPEALKKGMTATPDLQANKGFRILPIEEAMKNTTKYLFEENMAELEQALDFALSLSDGDDARSALNEIKVRSFRGVARGFCTVLIYGDELLGERNESHKRLLLAKSPKFDEVLAAGLNHRHVLVRELASASAQEIKNYYLDGLTKISKREDVGWDGGD
jgi:hypothetical protein